jgi:hypothetical protein
VARVVWVAESNPSPYRDGTYSCCLCGALRDAVVAVGFDEVMGVGRQRYRVEMRSVENGYLLDKWVDEKVYRVAALYSCVSARGGVYAVGATEGFWSVIVFDRELSVVMRRDFDRPRFIPYAVDTDGNNLFIAGIELTGTGLYTIHVEMLSLDDLTPIAKYTSNPRERGGAAYTIKYNSETKQILIGGFDNVEGFRGYRVEVLDRNLALVAVVRPGLRGAVASVSPGPQGGFYAVGRSGAAKIGRDGSVLTTTTSRTGMKVVYSATPPLNKKVAIIADNTIHLLDENLGVVESTRVTRGTEILSIAAQGNVAMDNRNLYIALTQVFSDADWGWSVMAVNPSPRRFRLF